MSKSVNEEKAASQHNAVIARNFSRCRIGLPEKPICKHGDKMKTSGDATSNRSVALYKVWSVGSTVLKYSSYCIGEILTDAPRIVFVATIETTANTNGYAHTRTSMILGRCGTAAIGANSVCRGD